MSEAPEVDVVARWREVRHSPHREDVCEAGDALAAALDAERERAAAAAAERVVLICDLNAVDVVARWREVRHSPHREDVCEAGDALAAALDAERERAAAAAAERVVLICDLNAERNAACDHADDLAAALEATAAERDRAHATLRAIERAPRLAARFARERLENP